MAIIIICGVCKNEFQVETYGDETADRIVVECPDCHTILMTGMVKNGRVDSAKYG